MNLQMHLLSRIAAVGLLCLLVIASHTLLQSHRQAEQATRQMAESLAKQLQSQLLLIDAGIGPAHVFPDFELWKQTGAQPGVCVLYTAANSSMSRSLCNGTKTADTGWPEGFQKAYRWFFNSGEPSVQPVAANGRIHGSLTVTPNPALEVTEAWNKTLELMALSTVTVFTVCLLVYLSITRALRPAQIIVSGLGAMSAGHLAGRLPEFELNEWQRIASAINQLACNLQQSQEERQKLTIKLINLQEQERRELARELHDEFGQCLAAINAVAASIKQSAAQQCPELTVEADRIGRTAMHMLDIVRNMLGRLRPAEFDELGLAASLNSLVAGWNARGAGKTCHHLNITGDCARLTEPLAMAMFRIAQESLTNIAKHAQASNVGISLTITEEEAILTVKDDGIAKTLPFEGVTGIGLLGIRERVLALQGRMNLAIDLPHGLILQTRLPIHPLTEHEI
ncbi:MAG: histidine kinase [Methylomonas sp.]